MLLSVVVIGKNEGERLTECLRSVRRISLPREEYELIYIDSLSEDDSIHRAVSLEAKVLSLNTARPNAAKARNLGLRASKGEFILFLDGDTVLHPEFVDQALKLFARSEVAIVSGILYERSGGQSLYNTLYGMTWNLPQFVDKYCGGNALIRKKALKAAGGYNPELFAWEEPEMCERVNAIGFSVERIPVAMGFHALDLHSFADYWKRAFNIGYSYASIPEILKGTASEICHKESRHNLFKGTAFLILLASSVLAAFLSGSWLPLALPPLIFLLLALRTAWRYRFLRESWPRLLLFALHSHFQHLPIFCGQLAYWLGRQHNAAAHQSRSSEKG